MRTFIFSGLNLLFLMIIGSFWLKAQSPCSAVGGLRIYMPGSDYITNSFDDPSGNHVFLCINGVIGIKGYAWVIKLNADGNDTVLRSFALQDTATTLYTGYYTQQHTYMFFGEIREDTNFIYSSFSFLWVLETDTLLNIIQSKKYAIPTAYRSVRNLMGYSLSPGKFTLLGTYYSTTSSMNNDDLFLAQFNTTGDTLKTAILFCDLLQYQVYTVMNPDRMSFSAIVSGFNIHVDNERLVIDSNMNFQFYPCIGIPDIQFPISLIWLSDTTFLAAGEKVQIPYRYWDIHICVAGISGVFYHDMYFGSNQYFDFPGWLQGIIRSADHGYYVGTTLKADAFPYNDTLMILRLDSNYQVSWKKYYAGNENFLIESILLKPDGNILVAAWFYDITQPQNDRDLVFFTVDSNMVSNAGVEDLTGETEGDFFTLSPNPGSEQLKITSSGPCTTAFQIRDVSGRQILGKQMFKEKIEVDVSDLSAGLYLVELENSGSRRTYKWVKK